MTTILSICFMIIVCCYIFEFVKEEKKLNEKRYENRRKKKNRQKFNINVK